MGEADDAHPAHPEPAANTGEPEGLYRLLLDGSATWELWLRPDGSFGYVSPSSERLTGFPPSAFLRDPGLYLGIVHSDDRGEVSRHLSEPDMTGGGAGGCDFRITAAGGETRWLHQSRAPLVPGREELGSRVSVQDVTAQRKAEEALRDSEARSQALFDHMESGVAVYEARGDGKDFAFVDINPAGQRLSRVTRQEVVGRSVQEVFPGVRDMGLLDALGRVCRSGRPEWLPVLHYRDERLSEWVQNYVFRLPSGQVGAIYHDVTERKQAEEDLRLSEERYRRLFDEAARGIALVDVETDTIQDCNREFLALTGYERSDLVGHPLGMLHPPGDGGDAPTPRAAGTSEYRLVTGSGILRDVEVKASPVEIGGRAFLLEFHRDVTEERRRQRERESTLALLRLLNERDDLREMARRLTSYLQLWSGCEAVGIRLREGGDYPYYETRGFPAEFVRAESSLCGREGEPSPEGTGSPVLECMCGDILRGRVDPSLPFFTPGGSFWTNSTTKLLGSTSEAERQTRTRNRCNGEGYESVALIPLRHGAEAIGLLQLNDRAPGRFSAELISFLEGAADQIAIAVAERRAEAALAESERRFREVSEAAGEFVWEVDRAGRVRYVSEQAREILGCTPEELLGMGLEEVFVSSDRERLRPLLARGRPGPRDLRRREVCLTTRRGRTVWLDVTAVPQRGETGRFLGFRGVCLDIGARKRLEADLRQAQRLEALGLLAGGVAHDFNNMLQVMIGSIAAAQARPDSDPSLRSDLEDAASAARKAADLTRQLLVFGRRQVLQPENLDLNTVIADLRKMLKRLVGERVDLEIRAAPALDTILADRGRIEQVLVNLCVNARDAMGSGGTLTLATGNVLLEADNLRIYPSARAGRHVALRVSDTGQGMDSATRARVFEPFFTTKEPGRGTGLGLATVYGIVTQHGGRIELETEPGRGARFTVCFPSAERAPAASKPAAEERALGGSERLLLCEDDPDVLKLGARLLRDSGYSVLTASDGEEALRLLERHERSFDLALLDLRTPKAGGRAVMERIRERHPQVRFLFTSGHDDDTISAELTGGEGIGAEVRLLRKPWAPEELLRCVREVLDAPR